MRKKISIVCMTLGALLLVAAISLAVYNRYEENRAAEASERVLPLLQQAIEANSQTTPTKPQNVTPGSASPEAEESALDRMTVVEIDGYGYIGYLSIPALELELPVMSEWDYTRLKTAPCRYYGSVKTGNMVIAAHNYSRHFGRLSQLKPGDTVRFTDMEGVVYNYTVGTLETLPPTATEEMIQGDWALSLYTCTYGGKKRVTVRCEHAEGER